jgi:hypothetical protein
LTDVGLLGEQVECIFYDDNKKEIFRSISLIIKGERIFISISTIQIRCPSPNREQYPWIMMRLKRNMTSIFEYQKSQKKFNHNDSKLEYNNETDNETDMFPVCILPYPIPSWTKHNFTICAANNRGNRQRLVEWIEYHKLIGVDHFVLYDTSTNLKGIIITIMIIMIMIMIIIIGTHLSDILSDYVKERTVTIITWPYENCVRHMASGHLTFWYPDIDKNSTENVQTFRPPRAIAQTAALSSCYSRYRSRSKYIGHVDEDEFFAFVRSRNNTDWAPNVNTITAVADALFQKYTDKPAIRFHPVCFYKCHPPLKSVHILPRVETWYEGKLEYDYNSKMIMRTDAVIQYFVHYVLDVEDKNDWKPDTYIVPSPKHAAMFHYKDAGSIWGNRLPLVIDNHHHLLSHDCDKSKQHELNFIDSTNTLAKGIKKGKVLHHIPKYLSDLLELKFTKRMEKIL